MKFESKFGMFDELKDKISGLSGKVVVISFYDTGCTHYGVAPTKLKSDGTIHDCSWLDESRLELIKNAERIENKESRSGPDINPKYH